MSKRYWLAVAAAIAAVLALIALYAPTTPDGDSPAVVETPNS